MIRAFRVRDHLRKLNMCMSWQSMALYCALEGVQTLVVNRQFSHYQERSSKVIMKATR